MTNFRTKPILDILSYFSFISVVLVYKVTHIYIYIHTHYICSLSPNMWRRIKLYWSSHYQLTFSLKPRILMVNSPPIELRRRSGSHLTSGRCTPAMPGWWLCGDKGLDPCKRKSDCREYHTRCPQDRVQLVNTTPITTMVYIGDISN